MEKNTKSGLVVVAVIAGLVVGGLGGYAIGNSSDDSSNQESVSVSEDNPRVDTKAADLRVTLDNALTEHVDLAAPALRAAFDGDESVDAQLAVLDNNSEEIATAVDSVYPGTKEDFLALWRDHIGFFADYTAAAKAGDEEAQQSALNSLEGYTQAASTFFSEANPNLPKDALQQGLQKHADQVVAIVNAYGAGNVQESLELQREATDHMSMTAQTLSGGIVTQFPEKF